MRRFLTAREQVAMTAPWRKHAADRADLRWERDGSGKWILVGRNPDGNPVAVPTERAPSVRTSAREDETEEEMLRRVYDPYPVDSPTLPDSLKPHTHLPIDVVHHYREFDRPYDKNTQMIERVIRDQGIRQPLRISTDGTHGMLIEGNHRLHAARRLGMTHLPVQVYLEGPGEVMGRKTQDMLDAHPGYHNPAPLEPVLADWINKNRHDLRSFWD